MLIYVSEIKNICYGMATVVDNFDYAPFQWIPLTISRTMIFSEINEFWRADFRRVDTIYKHIYIPYSLQVDVLDVLSLRSHFVRSGAGLTNQPSVQQSNPRTPLYLVLFL